MVLFNATKLVRTPVREQVRSCAVLTLRSPCTVDITLAEPVALRNFHSLTLSLVSLFLSTDRVAHAEAVSKGLVGCISVGKVEMLYICDAYLSLSTTVSHKE